MARLPTFTAWPPVFEPGPGELVVRKLYRWESDLLQAAERERYRRSWRGRLQHRLELVPWVVWATIVAAIALLCLLMQVRP